MPYPKVFGHPCWDRRHVQKVVSLTAHTSVESIPYFLAAHSPFQHITDHRSSGRQLSEEEVFQEIFSPGRSEVQAFVKGEPGTGKSHLIRWLKLRADYAALQKQQGIEKYKLVLVSRGNGSLKDALSQIVAQLGQNYERHTERVRSAIDRISDSTARATLLSELALEVGSRWVNERGRSPLHSSMRHLGQALGESGFGRWLKRDNGVIHRVVRRLTEQSTVEEREEFPAFSGEDFFGIPADFLRREDTSIQVKIFADDLHEEEETRRLVAEVLNVALQDAIRGLTGLRGSDLLEIFDDIRRELGPRKSLAIFIEDVSVTGLDQDVINAFEPRGGEGRCRMIAVLGVTNHGWEKMPDNQRQRGTHIYEVGGEVVAKWWGNCEEVAKFTARYLNSVRLGKEEVEAVAEERFSGDVRKSKCDNCPFRDACFEAFGKIELSSNTVIGMFPFTRSAPQSLLTRLSGEYYKSQRDLLSRVLLPVLDLSYEALGDQIFPRASLFMLTTRSIPWAGIENHYCGGVEWDSERTSRLRFLAQYWTDKDKGEDIAGDLQPLLAPLGLPSFSSEARPRREEGSTERPKVIKREQGRNKPEVEKLQGFLESWNQGVDLRQDNSFRDLVGPFLRKSIRWVDQRGTPITEVKRLVAGNRYVRIEGQKMRVAGQSYFVDLERSQETNNLLNSLLLFELEGGKSWDFDDGELHKRNISRWLRKNGERIVSSLRPQPSSIVDDALRIGIRTLGLATILSNRTKLQEKKSDLVEAIFTKVWDSTERPTTVTRDFQAIVDDVEQKVPDIQDYVVRELGVGQGEADPRDFIDPVPILKTLGSLNDVVAEEQPSPEIVSNFWKPRFPLKGVGGYRDLSDRLKKERDELKSIAVSIDRFMIEAGYEKGDLRERLKACLEKLVDLITLQRGSARQKPILPIPNPQFDQIWENKLLLDSQRSESWGVALSEAVRLTTPDDPLPVLTFNPKRFKELNESLLIVRKHLELLENQILDEESNSGSGEDVRKELLARLESIENALQITSDDEDEIES